VKNTPHISVPILDIHQATFLAMHGKIPELQNQSGRVIFVFAADDDFELLTAEYLSNPYVRVLDFVTMLRRIRSAMNRIKDAGSEGR
jgi:hypothetical protein